MKLASRFRLLMEMRGVAESERQRGGDAEETGQSAPDRALN